MPDAKNPYDFGNVIDFVEQDVGVDDYPFTGAVLAFPTDVGEHGKVRGGIYQPEQNPLGCVGVPGQQVVNDGGPVC